MDKILVTIHVPTIEKQYDFFLPINLPTKEVFDKIQKSINENTNGEYIVKDSVLLIDGLTSKVINQNNIIKFSGLCNGSEIMML